jgi:hypothetical protein
MTDECHVEPLSINTREHTQNDDCEEKSAYDTISEIESSVIYSQNNYQDTSSDIIQQMPTLEIAYLSNVRSECEPDMSIVLNPHTLSWDDFLTLFYITGNAFNVTSTDQVSLASSISFLNQTYENYAGKSLKFNLAQQVRIAWAAKCETTIENISPKNNILLNKETFGIRSLINSSYAVSVTLEEAITTLLDSGEIERLDDDSTTAASVRFVVQYKYFFRPLNTCVLVNFVFITNIPHYKNTNIGDYVSELNDMDSVTLAKDFP